jgi:predicted amidohydrolase
VAEAAWAGASLLVFPEYGAMELASLSPGREGLAEQLDGLQALAGDFAALFADLAARHGVHLLAPSFPLRHGAGDVRNVARLHTPDGRCGAQEKLIMSRFERDVWGLRGGNEIRVFDTALGPFGVAVGADITFPLIVRRMVEAGADLILVPSCSDAMAGYHRIRIGAQARALENQCYVVQAPTVGSAPWCVAVDANVGAAAVFAPPDWGLPDDGVLAMGSLDEPQWLFAELDFSRIEAARSDGQALHHRRWPEQLDALRTAVLPLA